MKTLEISLKEEYGLEGGVLKAITMDTPWDNPVDWRRPAIISPCTYPQLRKRKI